MSSFNNFGIICPSCNSRFEAHIWESINSSAPKHLLDSFRDGTLFQAKCPKCGMEIALPPFWPFLYNDMEHHVAIWFTPDNSQEAVKEYAQQLRMFHMMQYNCRIVFNHESLREKARIFDAGLDDRTIELIKIYLARKYFGDNNKQDQRSESLYFDSQEDQLFYFNILENGEKIGNIDQNIALYTLINCERETIDRESTNNYIIDYRWAHSIYDEVVDFRSKSKIVKEQPKSDLDRIADVFKDYYHKAVQICSRVQNDENKESLRFDLAAIMWIIVDRTFQKTGDERQQIVNRLIWDWKKIYKEEGYQDLQNSIINKRIAYFYPFASPERKTPYMEFWLTKKPKIDNHVMACVAAYCDVLYNPTRARDYDMFYQMIKPINQTIFFAKNVYVPLNELMADFYLKISQFRL